MLNQWPNFADVADATGATAVAVGTISDKPFTARHGLVAPMSRSLLLFNKLQ